MNICGLDMINIDRQFLVSQNCKKNIYVEIYISFLLKKVIAIWGQLSELVIDSFYVKDYSVLENCLQNSDNFLK